MEAYICSTSVTAEALRAWITARVTIYNNHSSLFQVYLHTSGWVKLTSLMRRVISFQNKLLRCMTTTPCGFERAGKPPA